MTRISDVALYYPWTVPSDRWLKQALLLCERTTSIVHPEMAPTADSALLWLERNGYWHPTNVQVGLAGDYISDVEDALLAFADDPQYRFVGTAMPPIGELARIYVGKLTRDVEHAIRELRLAHLGRFGGSLVVHRDVAAMILAITAKYVAANEHDVHLRVLPSTDSPAARRHAYDPFSVDMSQSAGIELLLDGLVPTPGPDVSFPDVIDFREHHRDELEHFRIALDLLIENVRRSPDPDVALSSAQRVIEQSVVDLHSAAASRRVHLISSGFSVLLVGVGVHAFFEPTAAQWIFDGVGSAVGVGLVSRAVRPPPPRSPYSYLAHAQGAFPDRHGG